ncbi:hypothetical protein GH714_002152 [Hevea brasiliensis]|uniref:FBD domain-containing protein n=1 Tax=Hevea brasiliensis TaxID=3981 RepID=A0A6A6LHS1_HEVBR|nr:hypothetical protein GH714_002152 [Hevea brasiliensis]
MEGNDANGICLDHWRLSIKTVIIPRYVDITDEHLQYIAERTPNLENLDLMEPFKITGRGFAEATCNWKHIQKLSFFMSDASLRSDQVIKSLCTMKTLKFKGTYMSRGNMNMILDQCVELEFICIADSYLVGNYFRLYGGDELITPVSANIRFGENECKISGRPRKFEGGDAVSYFQRKYTHWEIGHPTLLSSRHYLACGDFCITFGW